VGHMLTKQCALQHSDLLLLNLRCVVDHIERRHYIYNMIEICANTLMNGHWEELIEKVKKLLHATDHPHNYYILIQQII